jgi:carbonic anhydrase
MAGNIITSEVLASIEFAATQFKTPLCLVMGHSRCGAMEEAVKILGKKTAPATPLLGALVDNFKIPFTQTKKAVQELTEAHLCKQEEVDFTTALTHFNVHHGVEEVLRRSPILSDLAAQGEFAAIGAYYSLSTGKVTFLPEGDDQRLAQALGTGEVPVDGIVTRKS